jgi:endonuclease III
VISPAWSHSDNTRLRLLRRRMRRVTKALEAEYGTPHLGNLEDPLDEVLYILLTYQTTIERARAVWNALKQRFANWRSALIADVAELESVLRPAGFQRSRAALIKRLLAHVDNRCGTLSLESLRAMSTEEAESVLRGLPGVDIKGARCVLMYSLARPVLPVDSNVFRFMQRFGVLSAGARYRRRATHDGIQRLVAPADRRTLHINLVVHGQRVCLPREAKCTICPVRRSCPGKNE